MFWVNELVAIFFFYSFSLPVTRNHNIFIKYSKWFPAYKVSVRILNEEFSTGDPDELQKKWMFTPVTAERCELFRSAWRRKGGICPISCSTLGKGDAKEETKKVSFRGEKTPKQNKNQTPLWGWVWVKAEKRGEKVTRAQTTGWWCWF